MSRPADWREYLRWAEQIEEVLDPRCYTLEWLNEEVAYGRATPFASEDALILVEVRNYPAGAKELHGLIAVGELPAILELIETAEAWGRERGCDFATIASREGWGRVMKGRGYATHQVELRKDLV